MKPLAVALLVLFSLSVVSSVLTQSASALSAVTFTTKASATSVGQQFQRLYENGTNSVVALDGSSTNGTYYKTTYNVAAGTASSSTTTLSGSGNTINADAFASPVDLSRYSIQTGGSPQFVQAANSSVFDVTTQNFSLWGLLKRTSDSGATEFVAVKRNSAALNNPGYAVAISASDKFSLSFTDGSANIVSTASTASIAINTWYFWAASFNRSGNMTAYLYNTATAAYEEDTASIASLSSSATNTQIFTLSRRSDTAANFFTGRQDDLNILLGTAITSANVQALIANHNAITSTSRYDFNNGLGTSVNDQIGSNTLTLVNSPTWSSDVASSSISRPTTYITGRDTTTGKNGFAKLNLSDLSKVSDNYQTSSYRPKDIVQSTTKLYSPLYNGTVSTYGTMKLGIIGRDFTSYSEPTIYTGTSTAPAYGILANVTGSASPGGDLLGSAYDKVAAEKFTSTAALLGITIDGMQLRMDKNGTPTGSATVGTFDSSGNVITTLGTLDVSTLSTTTGTINLSFIKPYTIQANDRIGIKYTGGDGSNYIRVYVSSTNVYDGTNAYRSAYGTGWTDTTNDDLLFSMKKATAKVAVIDGSPDTEYVFFESGTSSLGVVKYTSSASTISTSLSHTVGQPYSIIPMSGKIIIQTSSATYSLNTSTDAITTLYNNSFNTRYPQPFTISPSARTYNTNPVYIANSTYAINYVPSTGTGTQTGVIISATTAPTLTAYAPSKYYYLATNSLSVEGATAAATTWTIKTVGSQNQFHVTPYSEYLGIDLVQNSTLFSQDVLRLVCGSGEYTDTLPYFATGSDSDCTEWRVLADSSVTVGREIFAPYSRTPVLVHTSPQTAYTFSLSATDPTIFTLKSVYDGQTVDVNTFDASGQSQQRYLYGQCYTIQLYNNNNGQTINPGQICANDATTKTLNLLTATVPSNWTTVGWNYNITRTFGTGNITTSNVQFDVDSLPNPYTARVLTTDNYLSAYQTYHTWYNFTNVNGTSTVATTIPNNSTIYFIVYDGNDIPRLTAASHGQTVSLAIIGTAFAPMGDLFGVPITALFVILGAAIFVKSNSPFGVLVVVALAGFMFATGMLSITAAAWGGIMVMAALGVIYAIRRY